MIIFGNTVSTTAPQSDYAQTDETRADFIKNKPDAAIAAAQAAAESAQTAAESAQTAADNAQTTAESAQTAADNALAEAKGYVDGKRKTASIVLSAGLWADQRQTVAVEGVTADASLTDVFACPEPSEENFTVYNECGVRLTAQLDGAVEFAAVDTPTADLTVNLALYFNGSGAASVVGLLDLTEDEGTAVTCAVDGEEYGVDNATVNESPTSETYDFTVL